MNVTIIDRCPNQLAIHVDFAGDTPADATGAVLTVADPDAILAAASASDHRAVWVLWQVDCVPWPERRIAAFVLSVAQRTRGRLFVVLDDSTGRRQRIAGHLCRAGCGRDGAPLSLDG